MGSVVGAKINIRIDFRRKRRTPTFTTGLSPSRSAYSPTRRAIFTIEQRTNLYKSYSQTVRPILWDYAFKYLFTHRTFLQNQNWKTIGWQKDSKVKECQSMTTGWQWSERRISILCHPLAVRFGFQPLATKTLCHYVCRHCKRLL